VKSYEKRKPQRDKDTKNFYLFFVFFVSLWFSPWQAEMSLYFQKQIKNVPVRRRRVGAHNWQLYLGVFLGCAIACGFVMAARYHFIAMDLGYQTEELKRQKAQLEVAQRKLQLELSRRTAPKRLDVRAQEQGLTLPGPRQTVAVRRGGGAANE
jgi:hypothetical protein